MRAHRRAHRSGGTKARRLRARVLWVCLAGGLFALAMVARPGLRVGLAQSGATQVETQREQPQQVQSEQKPGQQPEHDPNAEPGQDTNQQPSEVPANPDANHRAGKAHTEPQAAVFEEPVKTEPDPAPVQEVRANFGDPKQQQIADDSAALLKLASSLKADVDKTTVDTLSVAVIRHADEIEKLAHKMRTK